MAEVRSTASGRKLTARPNCPRDGANSIATCRSATSASRLRDRSRVACCAATSQAFVAPPTPITCTVPPSNGAAPSQAWPSPRRSPTSKSRATNPGSTTVAAYVNSVTTSTNSPSTPFEPSRGGDAEAPVDAWHARSASSWRSSSLGLRLARERGAHAAKAATITPRDVLKDGSFGGDEACPLIWALGAGRASSATG